MGTQDRGFAKMSPEERSKIASQGGKASGGKFTSERASAAGKKGAAAQSREAKAKGGRNSHQNM